VEQYSGWASEKAVMKIVVMPGTHDTFRKANMDAIDSEITGFLATRGDTATRERQHD
jgi:2-keto-3-deoxy-galactonokinase